LTPCAKLGADFHHNRRTVLTGHLGLQAENYAPLCHSRFNDAADGGSLSAALIAAGGL
jgi:hypothetical protein